MGWIGDFGRTFKIVQDLRAVNLSLSHGQTSIGNLQFANIFGDETPDAQAKEKAVWIDIDSAFSQPITLSDDAANYVPTQILAELFRNADYDAISYRSQFGEPGYNAALFNVKDAEAINGAPYQVTGIEVKYRQIWNRWFSTKTPRIKEKAKRLTPAHSVWVGIPMRGVDKSADQPSSSWGARCRTRVSFWI